VLNSIRFMMRFNELYIKTILHTHLMHYELLFIQKHMFLIVFRFVCVRARVRRRFCACLKLRARVDVRARVCVRACARVQ
jgi:hypothetical protein